MPESPVTRRHVLAGTTLLLTGCFGNPSTANDSDGYPEPFESTPTQRRIDTDAFERITIDGTPVPLAPIEATHYWYRRRQARFADARSQHSYDTSHIQGAALSTATTPLEDSPVANWPKTDRIVCYCGCPHHLSAMRAATLIQNGYEHVYVIDEGFGEWLDRGYPTTGDVADRPNYALTGSTPPRYAGDTAWAYHDPTGQHEATRIHSNGRYTLNLHFTDITRESRIRIQTPAYEGTAPLASLLETPVTGDTIT